MASEAARITFTSCDLFSILFSNGNVGCWKIVDSPLALSGTGMPPSKLMEFQEMKYSRRFQSRKLFFSHSGDLVVVDEGSQIVLLKRGICTPIKRDIKGSVACLTFSADDSLILFCI